MRKIFFLFFLAFWFINITTAVDTSVLDDVTHSLGNRLKKIEVSQWMWAEKAKSFLIDVIGLKIMLPLIVTIWLILAIISFYKLKFSEKEEDIQKSMNWLTWGTVWIVIMVSSVFILFRLINEEGKLLNTSWIWQAFDLYSSIIYPFLKLAFSIIIGLLFVVLVFNTIKFIISTSEDVKKHVQTIIIWDIIWILIMLWATNLVQLLYWKADDIANAINLGNIWSAIFENKDTINIIYTFLNYFLSFVAVIVLIIIIYQLYNVIINPEDENLQKSLKKSLVYIFIGFLLIVWWYLFVNFVLIK